jgi:hypothetical protein
VTSNVVCSKRYFPSPHQTDYPASTNLQVFRVGRPVAPLPFAYCRAAGWAAAPPVPLACCRAAPARLLSRRARLPTVGGKMGSTITYFRMCSTDTLRMT